MTLQPFITFITPCYRRPTLREKCVASVRRQTLVDEIQLFSPEDLVGRGVDGMYASLPAYAPAVHGRYVHLLADDDELASPFVVGLVRYFAEQRAWPDVILVNAVKRMEHGALRLPTQWHGVPICGQIDLGCLIVRNDIWQQHVHDYGKVYEGDYVFADALHRAGRTFERMDTDFVIGAVMRGEPEAV